MRRPLAAAAAALTILAAPAAAHAHPLGNFSVNHLSRVSVSSDRVDVRYILDQAEIPTFRDEDALRATGFAATRSEVARGLRLTVRRGGVPLRPAGAALRSAPTALAGCWKKQPRRWLKRCSRKPKKRSVSCVPG